MTFTSVELGLSEFRVGANGIELACETFGAPRDPALLLITGTGRQMIDWDEDLCAQFAARGLWVIRFDNRDVGHSTFFDSAPTVNLAAIARGDHATLPYTLEDMGRDAVGLLDALGIDKAHIAGASMGGMIAQILAIEHESRVLSLASLMSKPGRLYGRASPAARMLLAEPAARSREAVMQRAVRASAAWGSPGTDPDVVRVREARAFDRSFHPQGAVRHLAAAVAQADRTAALAAVRVPSVVIHGEADSLVGIDGGEATARAIPEARLVTIPNMGHDLPQWAFATITDAIAENAARVPSRRRLGRIARRLVRGLRPGAMAAATRRSRVRTVAATSLDRRD
jgi:pimeloyl-ACP methyl ester carboxylesterase